MRHSLLFACLVFTINVNAQKAPQYNWGVNGGGSTICTDINGDVWALGTFSDTITINNDVLTSVGPADMLLVKTDRFGNHKITRQLNNITPVMPSV